MKNSPRFFYGWIIVAVSFLSLFFSLGVRVSFGVYYVAILDEFGWTRADTAGAFSLAMCVHALISPLSGYLIDRFDPRKFFPAGAAFLAAGLIACSFISSIWHLYLFFGVITAIGINMTGFAPNMTIVPRWFLKNKGLASGLALSGIGAGSFVVATGVGYIIKMAGWRNAFLITAATVCIILIPAAAIFLRRSPDEIGLLPDNERSSVNKNDLPEVNTTKKQISNSTTEWTLGTAMKTSPFRWVVLTGACHGFMVNMMIVHEAIYIVDSGFSTLLAASILGITNGLSSVGNTCFGGLSDHIGRKVSLTLGAFIAFSGMIFLFFLKTHPSTLLLYMFTILYGIGQGSYTAIYASSMADLFAGPSLGKIMAVLSVGYGLGGALSSYTGGYLFDITGSYIIPFICLMVAICLGSFGIWMASPDKIRQ
ncbi:MAG: MFS transporter [Desulfobacteraceae bacterium]